MNLSTLGNLSTEQNGDPIIRTILRILIAAAIFGATFCVILGAARLYCLSKPPLYLSKVIIEEAPSSRPAGFPEDKDSLKNSQAKQLRLLVSKAILYPVIDNLKLADVWSQKENRPALPKEEAYDRLANGMIEVTPIRDTDLIQIGVYSPDRQEAANIANMIAVVYKEVRQNVEIQLREQALAQLKNEIVHQKKVIEECQAKLKEIRDREHILDPNPESIDPNAIITEEEKNYNDAKSKCIVLQARLDQIAQVKPGELLNVLASLDINDPTISKILPQYQEAVSEEDTLLKGGIGENHPRVKARRAVKEVYATQLHAAVDAYCASLRAQLKITKENMANWEEKLKADKGDAIAKPTPNQEYINTKNLYFNAKRLLEQAEQRYATQSVQVRMSVPVKIWEKAEPAFRPVKPHLALVMPVAKVAGGILGLLASGVYLLWAFWPRNAIGGE